MSDAADGGSARDYAETLFLPKTDFPMRAGLPKKEPELIRRWDEMNLYRRLRDAARGRTKFVLHDGPPYANGHLHIGHALNKILKDIVTRSHQMMGYDSNYVPGWDCHGLPIEWKVEEQYRARGRDKDEVPPVEFRRECRQFAEHWVGVQTEEFRRLGVEGDFERPYTTMSFAAEAQIARELMKFARSGQLYRGSKPVMWSVVERTALAEAEVEYHEHQSDTVTVAFPVARVDTAALEALGDYYAERAREAPAANRSALAAPLADLQAQVDRVRDASVLIWTTTPWTIPGNRAVSFSHRIRYGLYEVVATEPLPDRKQPWARPGDRYVLADALAAEVLASARATAERVCDVAPAVLAAIDLAHPLRGAGYDFTVPTLDGDHVTDEAGTGFVHTAPGHGVDDFEIWMEFKHDLEAAGIDTAIPYTVGADGRYTGAAPGFEGLAVIDDAGKKGEANGAVIAALAEAGRLLARGRLKHQYPHSWRSKKPVIFRNTPQWFIAMDRELGTGGDTLRRRALAAIDATRFVPAAGKNRLRGMIEHRPDWVVSRQRAWGVPITIFVHRETGQILKDAEVDARIAEAFEAEGADAWFADGAAARFLGNAHDASTWEMVTDILDVWFDSGSTHAFVLGTREDLKWPADVYLEGSDQHRGWFHSSLLESCGTRGRAPYETVVTHGFTMDEEGRKMSKSLGNTVAPQDVIEKAGADILRLWVASQDFGDDQRIGPEILKGQSEAYRKLRNTIRWMLGTLAHHDGECVDPAAMPELERLMMHRLAELSDEVAAAYRAFDYKRIYHGLFNFATIDLSAFHFDVRKDALYCDPASSVRRRAALQVIAAEFDCLVKWFAPILPFTMEEAFLARHPDAGSVHLEAFPAIDPAWRDDALAARWREVRKARRVVLGALEVERREKRIGASLEAHPVVFVEDPALAELLRSDAIGFADVVIASQVTVEEGAGPPDAFRLEDAKGVAVVVGRASGKRCARSWKVLPDVGADPDYPDLSPRDAAAMREFERARQAA